MYSKPGKHAVSGSFFSKIWDQALLAVAKWDGNLV
jgi:hypothetical protein